MIEGRGLTKYFDTGLLGRRAAPAVADVDIRISPGETLVLVGESGCGKSTLGRMLLYLIHPTRGDVLFEGKSLARMRESELRALRWKFQIISQHPDNALNPRWTIARSILEPFRIHHDRLNGRGMNGKLERLIDLVGLEPDQAARYPHQLSGGELQRAVIARAIALDPLFIVCDEPTSMLDVSIQASIIRLLQERQKEIGCACLFITHDIQLARILGDRVAVMLGGRIIEEGKKILDRPVHPFTRRIAFPHETPPGYDIPSDSRGVPGACMYLPYCPLATARCHTLPEMRDYGDRRVRCHMVA